MKRKTIRKLAAAGLTSCMLLPVVASAADEDLIKRIDALTKELEQLKQQVQANEAKAQATQASAQKTTQSMQEDVKKVQETSINKWLKIGGDYRFRVDSLRGETKPFTDVNATFANAAQKLQADFFANPSTTPGSSSYFGSPQAGSMSTSGALSALMGFSQAMNDVKTYDQAKAFLSNPQNAGLVQGLGAFAVQVPAYKPSDTTLYTNRFGLNLTAQVAQDVSMKARFLMYKTFGSQDESAVVNAGAAPFFADRVGVFDGTVGHVPSDSYLNVDYAYATWSNIADQDIWFSVGRRPTTNGAPAFLRQNGERPDTAGVPSLLIDYAFDGMSLGYAPYIDSLPNAFAKLCYGRGYDSGYRGAPGNSLSDTDMVGISIVPIDTTKLRVWGQWNHAFNIFDAPTMKNTYFGNTQARTNLGDMDWFGAGFLSTFKEAGPGDLSFFGEAGLSVSHPNQNVSAQFGMQGLLTGSFFSPEAPSSKSGNAFYAGFRYDLPSKTKFGFEFNRGSENWITFAPAADDIWTAKLGARGNVYEAYLIQELGNAPIASDKAKVFFRLGYQYYDFKYTGSNNWVGAPMSMSNVNGQMMTLTPLSKAYDLYGTFEVKF